MKKSKIFFIFGPTAIGKSDLLFCFPNGKSEVINVDSIQAYKEFNIGSAKPKKELLDHIKHHLVDFLDPNEYFSVGTFFNESKRIVYDLISREKIPIFVGGSAYYFKHLFEGLPQTPKILKEIRDFVDNMLKEKGKDFLLYELKRVDFKRYSLIHENDLYRIKRSLEVYYQTGVPISNFRQTTSGFNNAVLIGLYRKKEDLKERIYLRVKNMFDLGLIEEVKYLIKKGYNENTPAFKGIGYFEFLLWRSRPYYDLSDIMNLIINNSYLYAKRQIAFFSKILNVLWFHPEDDLDEILNLIFK